MRELSFLLDLLVNHKLGKATKDAILGRVKELEVELQHCAGPSGVQMRPLHAQPLAQPSPFPGQTPSMQAILARNPDLAASIQAAPPPPAPEAPVAPVAIIAQTPAAAAAMQSREQAIAMRAKGKLDPGGSSPRKW